MAKDKLSRRSLLKMVAVLSVSGIFAWKSDREAVLDENSKLPADTDKSVNIDTQHNPFGVYYLEESVKRNPVGVYYGSDAND